MLISGDSGKAVAKQKEEKPGKDSWLEISFILKRHILDALISSFILVEILWMVICYPYQ